MNVAEAAALSRRVEVNRPIAGIAAKARQVISETFQRRTVEATEKGIADPKSDEPRRALKIIQEMGRDEVKRASGKKTEGLERMLADFEKSKDPRDRVLAADMRIAMVQADVVTVKLKLKKNQQELARAEITPEEKQKCEANIKDLELELNGITDESGVTTTNGLTQTLNELRTAREAIPGQLPNSFKELGRAFGLSPEQTEADPLGGINNLLYAVTQNKKLDADFLSGIKANGLPSDAIGVIRDTLSILRGEKTKDEKIRSYAVKGVGLAAILAFAMAWCAGKNNQAQQAYAH